MKHFFRLSYMAFLLAAFSAQAQDKGQLSGDFQVNASVYDYDSTIGTNTTQYFHEKSSAEAWLYLNYRINDFSAAIRYDMFHNSPLMIPQEAYTKQGLAFYQISKSYKKFNFTVGSFYDQFGTGILFRAYEDRTIGLDYAMQGVRVQWTPDDSFMVKAFTGMQKNRFDVHPQVIKGVNTEKLWRIGGLDFNSGAAFINRTLDQGTMNQLANDINALPLEQRFIPKYNVYGGSIYNTITYRNISWFVEYAQKSREAVYFVEDDGSRNLINVDGNVLYSSLNFSFSGLGINLQYKKTENFAIRTSPYTTFLVGTINYLPALSKQHAYRLPARYSISALAQGEEGYQAEVTYSLNKSNTFNLNTSHIFKPDGERLFREYYIDYNVKFTKKTKAILGLQTVFYDQEIYEGKPLAKPVQTLTPFAEFTFRFDRPTKPAVEGQPKPRVQKLKPSLRVEAQYLYTQQDLGDFANILVELNLAPKLSFSVGDMVNTKPKAGTELVHYYSFFAAFTEKQTRFTAGYAKQVQGVVCTGGVCRVEPAFSGLRFGLSTNF